MTKISQLKRQAPIFSNLTGWIDLYIPKYGLGNIRPDNHQDVNGRIFFPLGAPIAETIAYSQKDYHSMEAGKRVFFDLYQTPGDARGDYCALNIEIQKDKFIDQPYRAKIIRYFRDRGFGFAKALDKKNLPDIYFHINTAHESGYDENDISVGKIITIARTRETVMRDARVFMVDRLARRPKVLRTSSSKGLNPD